VWLLNVEGLDFNPFTPKWPSIPSACETIIGWGVHGRGTKDFELRMRQLLGACIIEFHQHEEEAGIFLAGVFLEDHPVLNNQHEEDYYRRVASCLSTLWRRTVDLDQLRALVMYVVFARLFFLRATHILKPADKSVVACDAHVVLCLFLRYKIRFGRPEPNILRWNARQIDIQMRLATDKKEEVLALEGLTFP
jgi:hypothetical protein